jgi:DNA mismatch repair protein MutL
MTDIIRLLSDAVANQIAAGEVVQRPASVVKELLENTIDAGSTDIKLIIKESGKLLIQVIDNGCGMSERDARMCFERHATSKIEKADDLLAIRTLGFRGEALASIASVAQVELKSKQHEDEIGTCIQIEGTEFKGQFPVNCQNGTSVSVKNLFFNVPARRNFLKSNTLELKFIIEDFFRVTLVNPDIAFTFYNQDKLLYQLPPGNLKQRIINLYGSSYSQRLIPIEQQTALVNISGFLGKPEFAKKTRGEQYFFTNGRFMKSPYLHYAVERAFKELIPDDSVPSYFIYMEVDPQTIDVNIHPTKTEINFQDIKSIYAILHAAVKQSIGKFNISPMLDFEVEQSMNFPSFPDDQPVRQPTITINPNYNPFEKRTEPQTQFTFSPKHTLSVQGWQDLYANTPLPAEKIEFQDTPLETKVVTHNQLTDETFSERKKVSR